MKHTAIRRVSDKQKVELALRAKIKRELIEEFGERCMECGKSPSWLPLELSHEISLGQGGKTTKENCRILCHKCHAEKKHHERIIE